MITTLIIRIIKTQIPTGEKFSTNAQIDLDINNYFNVSDIHPDLLQAPFDKTKL